MDADDSLFSSKAEDVLPFVGTNAPEAKRKLGQENNEGPKSLWKKTYFR